MNLKVLGTGSKGNCYLLESESEILMIDCGVNPKIVNQALNFDYSKVVGCLLTHEHGDHAKYAEKISYLGFNIYAHPKTISELNPDHYSCFMYFEPKSILNLGQFKVLAFDVMHDVPCLGFLIEHPECGKLVFITDTFYCKYVFSGLNNIIIEANYSKDIIYQKYGKESGKEFLRNRIIKSHFSLENCIDMLCANDLSQVNNIVLIHLSDTNSDEKMFLEKTKKATGKNVIIANNGMTIPINKTPF